MAGARSREKLHEFLDYLGNKGLVPAGTVATRKSAATKILGILSDDEASDVTKLDLDHVMTRFQNLEGQNYTPGSLNTYLSRLRSAIEDFDTYLKNPLAFKPNIQNRDRRSTKQEAKKDLRSAPETPQQTHPSPSPSTVMPSDNLLPIPIRQDITIYVQGIPFDLTENEATKIANVIRAMAMPS